MSETHFFSLTTCKIVIGMETFVCIYPLVIWKEFRGTSVVGPILNVDITGPIQGANITGPFEACLLLMGRCMILHCYVQWKELIQLWGSLY